MSEKVNFRLPEELIEKTDITAEITHKNRTEIVKEALQEYINDIEKKEKFKQKIIELYLEDKIEFKTLKEFIGIQNAKSIESSKNILKKGEELSEKLANL